MQVVSACVQLRSACVCMWVCVEWFLFLKLFFSSSYALIFPLCWSFRNIMSTVFPFLFTLIYFHFRGTLSYKLTKNRKLAPHAAHVVLQNVSVCVRVLLEIVFMCLCSPEGFDFSHICLFVCGESHSRTHFSSVSGIFFCLRVSERDFGFLKMFSI